MKLSEIARLLGVPAQRIKDLKKDGVFTPEDYSEKSRQINYTENDVKQLQRIILFNKCSLSSKEIQAIENGDITLDEQLERKRIDLENKAERIQSSLFLLKPLKANSTSLNESLIKKLFEQARNLEELGMEFNEPQEYTWDGYNPYIQSVSCPTCHMDQKVDLDGYEIGCSSDECPMGPDHYVEVESETDSFKCIYCNSQFGVKGWFREYPMGAYDSSELDTFKEKENE